MTRLRYLVARSGFEPQSFDLFIKRFTDWAFSSIDKRERKHNYYAMTNDQGNDYDARDVGLLEIVD